jgi:heme exporter protein D
MNLLEDNNAIYLFTAYGVFLGGLTVYFVSLVLRRRALDRDEQIIEQVEQEENKNQ